MEQERNIKQWIIDMYNFETYQKLNAYYSKTTIFNILGAERNENRHSSFLCWLLNNKSSHGLGDEPMKKFLRLVLTKEPDEDDAISMDTSLLSHLMTGDYSLDIDEITTEKVIGRILSNKDKDRFDIWSLLKIKYYQDDETIVKSLLLVIENKIYSKEGSEQETKEKGKKEFQTIRYSQAIKEYRTKLPEIFPIMVFLTPSGSHAQSKDFRNMNYQDILDFVIEPLANYAMPQEAKTIFTDYIRNLSKPSVSEDEKAYYSILATSTKEKNELKKFYTEAMSLFDLMLGQMIESPTVEVTETEALLLTDLWNSNKELFKSVLYNVIMSTIEGKNKYRSLFQTKRDNTHYKIDGTGNYNKGRLIVELIKSYITKKQPKTIAEIQNVFPHTMRGETASLSNQVVVGNKIYDNQIKGDPKKQWRWIVLEDYCVKNEDGTDTPVYVHKEWGMSKSWPKTLKYMEKIVGVTITEI